MSLHRYPTATLMADYGRAGAGLVLTGGPLALVPMAPAVAWVLAAMALLFAQFAVRTFARQIGPVTCDERAVTIGGPLGGTVPWNDVTVFKLAFFATRRDRRRGWMELKVRGRRGRAVTIDSTIENFDAIVGRAVAAAVANGVALGATTRANLEAMGLDTGADDTLDIARATP
ncbi:MAG: hypothetical protein FJX36_04560 [Alphaproteobacteria bacterium]|nr:hypothetical protein [Alphaproteobacteria bacterium]